MQIAILGGTFDPIHTGHIKIAQNVLERDRDINEVWIMPALRNPFKDEAETPYRHRVNMCRLAVRNLVNIRVSEAESEIAEELHKKNLFTSEVLENLPKQNSYRFIIGADCVDRFYMWHDYQKILDEHGLIVFERPGFQIDWDNKKAAMVMNHPNVRLISGVELVDMSSSEIRDAVKSGKRVTGVPEAVGNYIVSHNLYNI